MKVFLNDLPWQLMGCWPYTPLMGQSMETGGELLGVTEWIDARVPGSVQADLLRAGLIEDPYYERNSLHCEWVEHRWWRYRAPFLTPAGDFSRVLLRFQGVDYAARFYLNGVCLGRHEGMFDPAVFEVASLLRPARAQNLLEVLLEDAPKEMSQIGYTSRSRTQKSRFNYKWDFSTRLVHLGIWADVELECVERARIAQRRIETTLDEAGNGAVQVWIKAEGGEGDLLTARLSGFEQEIEARAPVVHGEAFCRLTVPQPRRWFPNGSGEQPLYDLVLSLPGADPWRGRVGLRKLEYLQNQGAPAHALPYTFAVNGQRIYVKGVNMTPLDHLYGALRQEDYQRVLGMAAAMGVNLVRVWGGGLIEKEWFYDCCDALGILVWQEFIQSSSGLDNIPSKDPAFLALLETAATAALLEKRNHTCLAVWSGGNELMDARGVPANEGDENIALLAGLCKRLDPGRLFLPTSASGPEAWLNLDEPDRSHDIHGNWLYEGPTAHYARFNASDSLFHSEFGVNGMSSPDSLRRVFAPAHLRPLSVKENLSWRHRAEWWDSGDRDRALFGPTDDLHTASLLSQFIQAEGLRYALEANRRRAWRNSGSIIWQFNEPWPNANCTCLYEYSGRPKMAYYWVKRAYAPLHLSLRHPGLIVPAETPFSGELFVSNSGPEQPVRATLRLLALDGRELYRTARKGKAPENGSASLGCVEAVLPPLEGGVIVCELDLDGEIDRMLFSQRETLPFAALTNAATTQVICLQAGNQVSLQNEGPATALFVTPYCPQEGRAVAYGAGGLILFPGEARGVGLRTLDGKGLPETRADGLNLA